MTSVDARVVEPLLQWGVPQLRDFPWRKTRDRWAVLVSEVMAQQTQVSRVVPKFLNFMNSYPRPIDCASVPLSELLALWSGLGYPRRCKNLHDAAKQIVMNHGGNVPGDLDALLALPGVGPYTARAVLAFADEADVAVVDTNVARVLARLTNTPLSVQLSQELADELLPPSRGWEWNQVVMDLGAQVCTARSPRCEDCPISKWCRWKRALDAASRNDEQHDVDQDPGDPARLTALTSKPQARFEGSDRQARGYLMRALTTNGVHERDVSKVMRLTGQPDRAKRLLRSLVQDGLVVVVDGWCRLPD